MVNINKKINKLLRALAFKGQLYLLNKEQIYSNKHNKIFTKYVLKKIISVKKYNAMHPDKPKDITKFKSVKITIEESFKKIDILLKLVQEYNKVGERDA